MADAPPCSLRAAATAAAAVLDVDEFTLLRRLIRWVGLVGASETEWECWREGGGCLEKLPETGREVVWSCVDTQSVQHSNAPRPQARLPLRMPWWGGLDVTTLKSKTLPDLET